MKQVKRRIAALLICSIIIGMCPVGVTPSKASTHGLSNPTITNGVTTWDTIYFGNYWQEDTNGDGVADKSDAKTPIKWRVLSVNGNDAFLLADKNLDCQQYNTTDAVTWETCTLRNWLNDDFYNNAFTSSEQEKIMTTTVVNEDNEKYGTEGGNDTLDKIYLLSYREAMNDAYGFSSTLNGSETRHAKNTAYARNCGARTSTSEEYEGNGLWWLRSPGSDSSGATALNFAGTVWNDGFYVSITDFGVRPALHLNLSSTAWTEAGTVASDGTSTEPTVTTQPTVAPEVSEMPDYGVQNPRTDANGVTTWDTIYFGNYWQEDTNGDGVADKSDAKTPIKWRVLSVNGNDAFLLADKNLDCQLYNTEDTNVTWETCTLRSWLNDDFYNNAFDSSEQEKIMTTTVVNEDNEAYGTEGGNDTLDKIYLLSSGEAMNDAYGFSTTNGSSETREVKSTEYVRNCGAWASTLEGDEGNGQWWLRSLGGDSISAAYVFYDGFVNNLGYNVDVIYFGVRPALHLNLSSTAWTEAGTVMSGDTVTEPTITPQPTVVPEVTDGPQPTVAPEVTAMPSQTTQPPVTPGMYEYSWGSYYEGNSFAMVVAMVECSEGELHSVSTPKRITWDGKSYVFDHWQINGLEVDDNRVLELDFIMPANDVDFRANYVLEEPDTTEAPLVNTSTPMPSLQPTTTSNPEPEGSQSPTMYSVYIGKAQTNPTEAMNVTLWGNFVGGSYVSQEAHEIYTENGVEYIFSHWYAKGIRLDNPYERAISFQMPENEVTLAPVYRKKEGAVAGATTPAVVAPTPQTTTDVGGNTVANESDNGVNETEENQPKVEVVTPGTTITQGSLVYKVLKNSGKDKTVMVVKVKNKKVKTITIPKTIKIKGESFKVVEIAKNACKGCKNLKKVTIGTEVKVIGSNAFAKCKKLKTIVIKSKKLKKVGKKAFAGIGKKASIRVPKSKVKAYRKLLK